MLLEAVRLPPGPSMHALFNSNNKIVLLECICKVLIKAFPPSGNSETKTNLFNINLLLYALWFVSLC